DYNKEQEITRDYSGREILELLQNANDAAAEVDIKGKVLIELHPNILIVANTGEPFSSGGISSLIFSHISPKKRKRKKLIGQKGLGFRAALNWTTKPIIISGSLSLAYSHSKKEEVFEKLKKSSSQLRRLVEREQESASEVLVPTLPFPSFIGENSIGFQKSDENISNAIPLLTSIKGNGYDTVIGLPFEEQRYYEEAKQQVLTLIFSQR
ncbi:MAG: sacsin N-terminal ATP-binding-like domain-containing protein, partial [Bacteroidota bacterium]